MKIDDETFVVCCREAPVKGKVNRELIRELSKLFHREVEILAGLTSRHKKILIKGADEADIHAMLKRV